MSIYANYLGSESVWNFQASMQSIVMWLLRLGTGVVLGTAALLPAGNLPAGVADAQPGSSVRELTFKDVLNGSHQPLLATDQKATVLFFVMHDCPISNGYAPEINRLCNEYRAKGVRSFIVYVEMDVPIHTLAKHAKDYGFVSPALLDPAHRLVKITGVTVAPEVAVVSPGNRVLYRGRIDDRAADFGKVRPEPARRDLRTALNAILAGQPVPTPVTKAVGCYIQSVEK